MSNKIEYEAEQWRLYGNITSNRRIIRASNTIHKIIL